MRAILIWIANKLIGYEHDQDFYYRDKGFNHLLDLCESPSRFEHFCAYSTAKEYNRIIRHGVPYGDFR